MTLFRDPDTGRDSGPDLPATTQRSAQPGTQPTQGGDRSGTAVLVGVDGSANSMRALQWAVVRADATCSPLRILHALEFPVSVDPYGLGDYVSRWKPDAVAAANQVLQDAARVAHELSPQLVVSTHLKFGAPAVVLAAEGRRAELIVLGHGAPRWLGFLTPTVNVKVARRARGRVVVVGPDDEHLA
jgi:nucleotide-binding universal stress UspA family protein